MFSHDVVENRENKVVFEEMDETVFSKMITYIYTDDVEDVECQEVLDLLKCSDMYNIR